ncbi:MAG: hypothetical protein JNL70_03500 [Saprospiraceae bacterium]|nr:hypothetical protein [Saprospiraceae bacterium]
MKQLTALLLIFTMTLFDCTSAQNATRADWRFIADRWINFGLDHDAIHFGDLKDDFRQIKIRVTDAPLKIYDMKIHFDNGDVQDVSLKTQFRQGEESRVIDLNGGLRHLRKIEFWYETKGVRKGKSRIAVWGKR